VVLTIGDIINIIIEEEVYTGINPYKMVKECFNTLEYDLIKGEL